MGSAIGTITFLTLLFIVVLVVTKPAPVDAHSIKVANEAMCGQVVHIGSAAADEGAGAVSVANTSTAVLAANADRLAATFVNDSDETIYLSLGEAAVMNKGIRLNAAGGSYSISSGNRWTGTVSAICSSGSKVLCITEF